MQSKLEPAGFLFRIYILGAFKESIARIFTFEKIDSKQIGFYLTQSLIRKIQKLQIFGKIKFHSP